ncbi:MAG TPA: hypothetical protein VGC79_22510 [Polyangiaceae bacterium]
MWRFRVESFAIGLVLASAAACGGRARNDGSGDGPSLSAGMGGANGAGAAGGAEAESDLNNSCPQTPSNRSCPATKIDISFTRDAVDPRTEVWVEPLQIPDYPQDSPTNLPEVEPSKWDRSPLPAGACVLRIHGLSGGCLQPGTLHVGSCAALADPDAPHVVPFGYYEGNSCRQGIAPGCPSAAASDSSNGNWWYLVARGEDTDLVVCAPECGTAFGSEKHACLRLRNSG